MRIIAITNHKGGSAKTTTVVNLAAALGEAGDRVLVVDLDPQGSATSWLGSALADRDVRNAYLARSDLSRVVVETTAPGVELIPASPWLVAGDRKEEVALGLGFIEAMERLRPEWDVVLIDCPPSQGSLSVAPLGACHEVVIPVEARALALTGVVSLLGTMEAVRERLNPDLALTAIVACRVNRTRHARDVVERLRARFGRLVLDTVVRESIGLAEAPSFQLPITRFAPTSPGSIDYRDVAMELRRREERPQWVPIPIDAGAFDQGSASAADRLTIADAVVGGRT